MDALSSSQEFIRSLKAPSDPPQVGGPTKYKIAREGWDDEGFYLPNKAEVIAEWILSKFLKEKANKPESNALLSADLWSLLHDVLSGSKQNTRALKTWLAPLLNRVPFPPTVSSFLKLLNGSREHVDIVTIASASFELLWPSASQKLSTEALLEIFGSYLDADSHELAQSLSHIGQAVTTSFKNSFYNSSNKRKIHTTFTQNHLTSWMEEISNSKNNTSVAENVYAAGIEVLFCLDVLRLEHTALLDGPLFSTFSSSSPKSIYSVLPRLLKSYTDALRKYRGALFGQASTVSHSSLRELQMRAMEFFGSCISILDRFLLPEEAVAVQLDLLRVVESEQLFSAQHQAAAEMVIHQLIDKLLENSGKFQKHDETLGAQIGVLSTIARIDFALLKPGWRRIIDNILRVPSGHAHYAEFTSIIIDHYSKTRSLDEYIESWLSAFRDQRLSSQGDVQKAYFQCLSGPFFQQRHVDQLSRAINVFITETQASAITKAMHDSLEGMCTQLELSISQLSAGSERPSKKRRIEAQEESLEASLPEASLPNLAIHFVLSSRLAELVFSAISFRSLAMETRDGIMLALQEIHGQITHVGKSCLKRLKTLTGSHAWSVSVIATAALRFRYALGSSKEPLESDKRISHSSLMKALRINELLPEIRHELFRTLLSEVSLLSSEDLTSLLEVAIVHLERHFANSSTSWSGHSHVLSNDEPGENLAAIGLVHLLLHRFLPALDALAAPGLLRRLIGVLFNVLGMSLSSGSPTELDAAGLLQQALQTASFWELGSIRDTFVLYLQDAFAQASRTVQQAESVIRLLLSIPTDYLPRPMHLESIKFAFAADRFISSTAALDERTISSLSATRLFLARTLASTSNAEQLLELLTENFARVLCFEIQHAHAHGLEEVTVELIDRIWLYLFRWSSSSKQEFLVSALGLYKGLDVGSIREGKQRMLQCGFSRMVEVVTSEISISSLHESTSKQLRDLCDTLTTSVSRELENSSTPLMSPELYSLWQSLLSLRKWCGSSDIDLPLFGQSLIAQVMRTLEDDGNSEEQNLLLHHALAIALEEINLVHESERFHSLKLFFAAYLSIAPRLGIHGCPRLDGQVSKTLRNLSVTSFSNLASLLTEHMSNTTHRSDFANCIHLVSLMFKERPQKTLKELQNMLSKCLLIFIDREDLLDGSSTIRRQALGFVESQATEHHAVLRPKDMGPLWTLLLKALSGSAFHEQETSPREFHSVVNTISALIRLRRDLVVNGLPLLCSSLRQLILCLRTLRPQLGSKQTSIVENTLPRWLNTSQPLGVEEAKALSRLLQSLTVKSLVRNNTSAEMQKAESLAKVFSKHAIWVVKSYVEAMNDPLCVVPLDVRKELRHGLYVLLGIINEHDRDALMVTALDAGGKSTIKALWKEYEKQRYVGKG